MTDSPQSSRSDRVEARLPAVLFRCMANTDLSAMAHAILRVSDRRSFVIRSSGSHALDRDTVTPFAFQAMAEVGIPLEAVHTGTCKEACIAEGELVNYAISLDTHSLADCEHATVAVQVYWPLPEAEGTSPAETYLDLLRQARGRLKRRIGMFINLCHSPTWVSKSHQQQADLLTNIHEIATAEELAPPYARSTRARKGVTDLEKERQPITRSQLITVVFEDESEYVKFVRHVYQKWDGDGLEFTNVPIVLSARVTPSLLRRTEKIFQMRPLMPADLQMVRQRLKGHRPFDADLLAGGHVPGFTGPGNTGQR